MMDLKRLNELACDFDQGFATPADVNEMVAAIQLLTNPDPLTLDAAVKVMGREPDETFPRGYRGRWDWGETTSLRVFPDGKRTLRFGGNEYDNPTIGQFACLVAAARMGEKA